MDKSAVKTKNKKQKQRFLLLKYKKMIIPRTNLVILYKSVHPDRYLRQNDYIDIDNGIQVFLSKIDTSSMENLKRTIKKYSKEFYKQGESYLQRWTNRSAENKQHPYKYGINGIYEYDVILLINPRYTRKLVPKSLRKDETMNVYLTNIIEMFIEKMMKKFNN